MRTALMCLGFWKSILKLNFFLFHLQMLDTVIHNDIHHRSLKFDISQSSILWIPSDILSFYTHDDNLGSYQTNPFCHKSW